MDEYTYYLEGKECDPNTLSCIDKARLFKAMVEASFEIGELPPVSFLREPGMPDWIYFGPVEGKWKRVHYEPWMDDAILAGCIMSNSNPDLLTDLDDEERIQLVDALMRTVRETEDMIVGSEEYENKVAEIRETLETRH